MIGPGVQFSVPRYDCVWTVLYYHRGGSWVCQEAKHKTTCEFYTNEILRGAL